MTAVEACGLAQLKWRTILVGAGLVLIVAGYAFKRRWLPFVGAMLQVAGTWL